MYFLPRIIQQRKKLSRMKWIASPQQLGFVHPGNIDTIDTKGDSIAGCNHIITLGIIGNTEICTEFYAQGGSVSSF